VGGGEGNIKESPAGSRFICLQVPKAAIGAAVIDLGGTICRRVEAKTPALRLLRHYVGIFQEGDVAMAPALQHQMVTHIHDLFALTLGATPLWRGGRECARRASGAAARDQGRHPRQPRRWRSVRRCHRGARRLPVRYVQRLFEVEGITFTEFVLAERPRTRAPPC